MIKTQNWYQNAKEKTKTFIKKSKRTAKNLGLAGLVAGSLAFGKVNADIRGFVQDSHDDISGKNIPVKIYRKQVTGGIDTLYTNTNENGRYLELEGNFNPNLAPGETTFVYAWKDTLSNRWNANLMFIAEQYPYQLEITLDNPNNPSKSFTASLGAPFSQGWIRDTSGIPDPLQGIYWLAKNPKQKCTTQVDTGYTWPFERNWRTWFNFEEQDSIAKHGNSAYISLEKNLGDTTWRTLIPFTIDTTWLGAMKVADNVWFPLEKIINDTTPPEISNATAWENTIQTEDYAVQWTRTDESGILKDSLEYKINNEAPIKILADSVRGDTAYATIEDTTQEDDSVYYKVWSVDNSGNANTAHWPETGYHSFEIEGVGIDEKKFSEKKFEIYPNPFYSNVNISYPIEKAQLYIYNVSGRLVDKVQVNDYKAEWGKNASKGVYFVKPKAGESNGKIEVKNKVWKLIKL